MQEEYKHSEKMNYAEDSHFISYNELMNTHKLSFEDIKEHLTGPFISTILHIILLAFLGTLIVTKAPVELKDITVTTRTVKFPEIDPIPPQEKIPEAVPVDAVVEVPVDRPEMDVEVSVDIDKISVDSINDTPLPSVLNMQISNSVLSLPVNMSSGPKCKTDGKFLNIGSSGQRFFFIIDYSASMGRDNLLVLKSHLMKALKSFKGSGQIALLFFAGPIWLPEEDGKEVRKMWSQKGQNFHCTKDGVEKLFPKPEWMVPTKKNIEILDKYICQTQKVGGTNWSLPFTVALKNMKQKPDVIFFMTDGAVSSEIVNKCNSLVKKYGQNITINTIAFGAERGWKDLEQISALSKNGVFKGFSPSELKKMAEEVKLPVAFTDRTKLNYNIPKVTNIPGEKDVEGLIIK